MDSLRDVELQAHYDEMFSLFGSKGWAAIVEKAEALRKQYDSLRNIKDEAALYYRKGQLDILDWIVNQKVDHELTYRMLLEHEAEDA